MYLKINQFKLYFIILKPYKMILEFLKSQRNADLLIYDNFIYNKDTTSSNNGTTRWRCRVRSCKGAIFTNANNELSGVAIDHNHQQSAITAEKIRIINGIKKRAIETTERSHDILAREIVTLNDDELIIEMPTVKSLKQTIRRARNVNLNQTKDICSDIPEVLKNDSRGNLFLRFDSGIQDNNRFLIFTTKFKEQFISKIETIVIDGTFRSAPPGFFQLIVVHGFIFNSYYPLFHILMKNKSELTYVQALKRCMDLVYFKPKLIISDFERALINAIRIIFFFSQSSGCLFHFAQSIWKHIGYLKLIDFYKTNKDFKNAIKMVICLAFVPLNEVLSFYTIIKDWIITNNVPNTAEFLEYFENTYIGTSPMFDILFWNVYERVKTNLPRTSNGAESWNRTLNLRMESAHPNIAQFITEILKEEELNIFNLKRALNGKILNCRQNIEKEHSLFVIVSNFQFFTPIKYLNAIILVYTFKFDNELNK